jgi:hypothetical protein
LPNSPVVVDRNAATELAVKFPPTNTLPPDPVAVDVDADIFPTVMSSTTKTEPPSPSVAEFSRKAAEVRFRLWA